MSFRRDEVTRVQKEVEEENKVILSHELLYSLVSKVEKNKRSMPFGEALRFSLNELNICEEDARKYYKKAVGKLYGKHGGRKKAQNRKSGVTSSPQKRSRVGETFEEDDGQFAFRI